MSSDHSMHTNPELRSSVGDALANILTGIREYVFNGQRAQYRSVAIELRKLLLDKNSAQSFVGKSKNSKSLFELVYGHGERIVLQSLAPHKGLASEDGWVSVGPPLYRDLTGIISDSSAAGRLLPLRQWLDECPVHDSDGARRKTGKILKEISDKEGAHIIRSQSAKDWRSKGGGITFASRNPQKMPLDEVATLPYDLNWQQFVIGAGARLLYARRREAGGLRKLFDTRVLDIAIQDGQDTETITLQRRIS